MCHGQLYQQRMKKAFDKKVKPRVFREGDLVLKKVLSFAPDSRGKWTPNYEGPYVVKRAFSGGALMLTTMDGEDFTRPVNSDAIVVGVVPQAELLLRFCVPRSECSLETSVFLSSSILSPAWVLSFWKIRKVLVEVYTSFPFSRAVILSSSTVVFPFWKDWFLVVDPQLSSSASNKSPVDLIYLCDLFNLSGFIPNGVADSIPGRVAYAARFYLCVLFSSAVSAHAVNSCFPVETGDSPAEISGFLHFPNRFVFVAVSACCELLFPSWVD
ncbi:hypothetical protein KIW84_053307 [Lathyrus oleraceus]|uniref:Uncharacterized protein n=1 Tax=Pisum sativum TaxID=3888 RepID=A0A9D4WSL7_PEA|nr:hypothetical protein KIW84_053307 [Pisum sativum]